MVELILKRAGMLEYERLVRVLQTACRASKHPLPNH